MPGKTHKHAATKDNSKNERPKCLESTIRQVRNELAELASELKERNAQLVAEIADRNRAETQLLAAVRQAESLALFPEENPNPVLRTDMNGVLTYRNPAVAAKMPWIPPVGEPLPENMRRLVGEALSAGGLLECELPNDGRTYWLCYAPIPEHSHVNIYCRDVTERSRTQDELGKFNRTLTALSQSSQAMVRAQSETEYLNEVCRIVVTHCRHVMVWIGYAENDEHKTVRPVASAGFDAGYLEELNLTYADTPRGRGPTGTAIRTGKPAACPDMRTDPNFAPWRDAALKRGYASSLVLPLMADGKAFGAMTVYSHKPHAFHDAEVRLLAELADDLAHGVTRLRLRRDRMREESYRNLATAVLQVLNQGSSGMLSMVAEVLRLIRESLGFDVVGLRLRKGEDFPYYQHSGMSNDFLKMENSLCSRQPDGEIARCPSGQAILECTCGLVLSGKTDPGKPFFTAGGSFWTNASAELLELLAKNDPRTNPRNRCVKEGYQSVALIPVRSGDEIVGLLQLNSRAKGRFHQELLRFLENLAGNIGLAMQRCQVEEALQTAKDELERRVRERTTELANMVEILQGEIARRSLAEQVLRERSDQLRLLASELTLAEQRERRRLAELLHDNLQQLLVGAKFCMAPLERAGDQAVRQTTNDVLDLLDQAIDCSRSLTGELSPPILHQAGLAPALHWLAQWTQQKHGLSVSLQADDDAPPASEDVTVLLFQSVRELLFNAAKHANVASANVSVKRSDGQIEVVVSDDGAGFDANAVADRTGSAGGFGLFSIRERLDLLGGRMEIDSTPGKGSRITLRAPALSPTTHTAASASSAASPASAGSADERLDPARPAGRKIRVLLVDDHNVTRQGLANLLAEFSDIEVVAQASDGQTAIDLVRRLSPDVVTMDINMPGMDGIETTRRIHKEFPDVRIVGLSMFEESDRAKAMHRAGAVVYLTKSAPADSFITAIRTCAGLYCPVEHAHHATTSEPQR